MAKRRYPVVLDWEPASTEQYWLMVGMKCGSCDHLLGKNEKFWRRETQVSYMRGEDEVEIKCAECKANGRGEHGEQAEGEVQGGA